MAIELKNKKVLVMGLGLLGGDCDHGGSFCTARM